VTGPKCGAAWIWLTIREFLPCRLILALAVICPLFAVNPSLSIGQYLHTSWTQEEGYALPPIQALAQTQDGYLWLGTSQGLIRFDGFRFVDWSPEGAEKLPSQDIRCCIRQPATISGSARWRACAASIKDVSFDIRP